MLKRFMSWLLNRVQSLLGVMSGRRSSSSARASESSSNLRDRINQLSQQTRQADSPDSAIPVAARDSLILSAEPLAEPADDPSSPIEDPTEPTEPTAAAEKNVGKPIDFDANTHRHLDVSATALSDAVSVKPTFPTEVSELMGSPSSNDTSNANKSAGESVSQSTSANPSFRTLKKISDDQLPAIHDLLPAVETSPDELASPSSKSFISSDQTESAPRLESADNSLLASEQAILFSFDIIESEEPAAESPLSVEQPCSATDLVGESSDAELEIFKDANGGSNRSPGELPIPPARKPTQNGVLSELPKATILTDADLEPEAIHAKSSQSEAETGSEPLENLTTQSAEVSQPTEELSKLTANVETLPYPWLLPAPEAAPKIESEAHQSVEAANEERPVKNGVVKLLFTLKEGNFHGYVAPNDGTKDILFHEKYINADIFSHLERGIEVAVSVKYIEGKPYATRVELL